MVSTHQQYLCPDFLNPSPPATVDSSPLALLAQTCNSIGLPDPPPSGGASNGTSSKSAKTESTKNQAKDDAPSKGHSATKKTTTSAADSSSDSSAVGSATRSSPVTKETTGSHTPESSRKAENRSRNAGQNGVSSSDTAKTSEQCSAEAKSSTASSTTATSAASSTASSLLLNKCMSGASNPLTAFSTGAFPPALFPSYFPTNSTPVTAYPFGPSVHMPSLAFATGSCYPPFPSAIPSASNPWLPPSMPGFTPKCTDPFCKTCPAIAGAVRGPCAVGCPCLQCGGGHSAGDLPLWLSSYGSLLGQSVGLHGTGSPLTTNTASLYAAAAAAAAAAQQHANSMTNTNGGTSSLGAANQTQQQHTCSWMTGSEFCGKRFSSSEELLQHLRSHTSHDSATAAAVANSVPSLSTSVATSTPAAHLSAAGRLSPRSTYLSSLNSLRYHPYAKLTPPNGSSAAAAAAALASLPFPPTATPFSPLSALCTSLSAQRLPASLPHP